MRLCIDVGNTRIKLGIFDDRSLVHLLNSDKVTMSLLRSMMHAFPIRSAIVSVVGKRPQWMKPLARQVVVHEVGTTTKLNFTNRYRTPETLGSDRLANLVAARHLFPNENTLIVSTGTCITYDLLQADGVFYGGSILPGIDMRLRAEHTFTNRLPWVEKRKIDSLFGTDTGSALLTGAINGVRFEFAAYVSATRQYVRKLIVLLTGGDTHWLLPAAVKWKETKIFALPELALVGLNEMAILNELPA